MIGLETSTKIGKAPKRARVELKENKVESTNETYEEDSDREDESDDSGTKDDSSEASHDTKSALNAGWADVMQKILRTKKPKRKRTVVLAKAKKLGDLKIKEKKKLSFEIDGIEDEIEAKSEEDSAEAKSLTARTKPARRETSLGIRVKPSITDRERERMLQKIATKGIVQLFNAVRQQQTDINKKLSRAGPLERKREQVLQSIDKNSFLDILMGGAKSISVDKPVKPEETIEPRAKNTDKDDKTWSVLRDDFVMGAKLKDWDKKDTEEDSSAPEDLDSDD